MLLILANYLINIGPSSTLDGGILGEDWKGKLVNYSFLKVLGYEAYDHIDKEYMKKLDAKSK